MACILSSLLFAGQLHAATYYVSKLGNNTTGDGSSQNPWLTIGKCSLIMMPGDTCIVGAGTYEETVSPARSGIDGNMISYAAKAGDDVTVRQFMLSGKNYIRIIGFTITHNSIAYYRGIAVINSNYNHILNNSIHHTYGAGIGNGTINQKSSNNIIRGNTISFPGCPSGVAGQCLGTVAVKFCGDNNLMEYNTISHSADYFNTYGQKNIMRNNHLLEYKDSDFTDQIPNSIHTDGFQSGSQVSYINQYNVFENNYFHDNCESNSHGVLMEDDYKVGDKEFIIRGNVILRMTSASIVIESMDNIRIYNNTIVDTFYSKNPKDYSTVNLTHSGSTGDPSLGNYVINNIFFKAARPDTGTVIAVASGSEATAANNLCEESGIHSSCLATSATNFVDYANDDLHLLEASSARNIGKAMTSVTSPNGNGISFTVADAGFFTDGAGLVAGDFIKVGSANPVKITAINYEANLITVSDSISWDSGASVSLALYGSDIGAYPYKSGNGKYEIQITNPADGVTVAGKASITAYVTNADNVRFVIFYVDGIPASKIENAPYTFVWNLEGLEKKNYQVEARAYPFYADPVTSRSSKINLIIGDASKLSPPSNLSINQ